MENMDKVMQAISDVEVFDGTFIKELFEAMQNGYINNNLGEVADGEKIVGEMNELEKALDYLLINYGKTEERIISRLQERPCSPEERKKLIAELERCRSRFRIAKASMWENIETRLAGQDSPSIGWGLRSGHKIVILPVDDDLISRSLFKLMMRGPVDQVS